MPAPWTGKSWTGITKENAEMTISPRDAAEARQSTPAELVESVAPLVIAWAETAASSGVGPAVSWNETDGLTLGYLCPCCDGQVQR